MGLKSGRGRKRPIEGSRNKLQIVPQGLLTAPAA